MDATRIHALFDGWLRRSPDRVFLHLRDSEGEPATMTYAQVGALVDTLEAELRTDGVRAGDRVMVVAENCPQHLALILACSRVGAWSCGVNARMAPGEIAGFSAKADARVHILHHRRVQGGGRPRAPLHVPPLGGAGLERSAVRRRRSPRPARWASASPRSSSPPAPPARPRAC
jgi:acyl-coenzyme A synthetase/AMP-(fatty) acid ligase